MHYAMARSFSENDFIIAAATTKRPNNKTNGMKKKLK